MRTMRSVTSQDCNEWRVIVACEDVPPDFDGYLRDSRVEVIQMPKKASIDPMDDKGRKVNAIACKHREYGAGYLMLVDADDLVSNRIASLCKSTVCNGFYAKRGYLYFEGHRCLKVLNDPWKMCGSCTIVNWRTDELPTHFAKDIEDLNQLRDRYIVNASHNLIPQLMYEAGRPLMQSPFALTIYSCGNGENNSLNSAKNLFVGIIKNALRKVRPTIILTAEVVEEFSLYPVKME